MVQLAIFDMDGTIADTSPGILNSHRYAHRVMGWPEPDAQTLSSVIGGPLLQTYIQRFGFSEGEARTAVNAYREYYSRQGIHEARVYPGLEQTLKILRDNGVQVAMATLKAERFAKTMLEDMGISRYFQVVYGMDEQDTRTKAQLIQLCTEATDTSRADTVMVGDSIHDRNGAAEVGVNFLGVTYGFGFQPGTPYDFPTVDSAIEIADVITGSSNGSGCAGQKG